MVELGALGAHRLASNLNKANPRAGRTAEMTVVELPRTAQHAASDVE